MIEINVVDAFTEWYDSLSDSEEERVAAVIDALEEQGVNLREPYSKPIKGSRHSVMHELRPRHKGDPIRILYCLLRSTTPSSSPSGWRQDWRSELL